MMDRITAIESRLRMVFNPENLEVTDDSQQHIGHEGARGGGGHYSVTIISALFSGQNMIKRHRLIYDALNDMMHKDIHALSIRALAPEEI